MIREIPLTRGHVALVDEEDYERVMQFKWHSAIHREHRTVYATTRRAGFLHRLLLNAPRNMYVDHVDGNGLNNTRANLRLVTPMQNTWNQAVTKRSSTGFRGVYLSPRGIGYRVRISRDGKRIEVGTFACPVKAAIAYNNAAREVYGRFARLNAIPEVAA